MSNAYSMDPLLTDRMQSFQEKHFTNLEREKKYNNVLEQEMDNLRFNDLPWCDFFRLRFDKYYYVEFNHNPQDKIVGTKDDVATVYDMYTGQSIISLFNADSTKHYTRNKATFHPRDDLVLSDGILWDYRSDRVVHKFDKLNPHISGLFHPRGLEIIINTEVWDIRTYRLLHTVNAFDQCKIVFNSTGDIIYSAVHQFNEDDCFEKKRISRLGSSFSTFDATDYTLISTVDMKKNIIDLCVDKSNLFLAVIKDHERGRELSVCRLFEVGKQHDMEDERDDQQEDDADDADDEEEEVEEDDFSPMLISTICNVPQRSKRRERRRRSGGIHRRR